MVYLTFVYSRWISVLNNAKEQVLMKAFQESGNSTSINQHVHELTTGIKERIKRLPGNRVCCDCGAPGRWGYYLSHSQLLNEYEMVHGQ
jgi:hypothetical protein